MFWLVRFARIGHGLPGRGVKDQSKGLGARTDRGTPACPQSRHPAERVVGVHDAVLPRIKDEGLVADCVVAEGGSAVGGDGLGDDAPHRVLHGGPAVAQRFGRRDRSACGVVELGPALAERVHPRRVPARLRRTRWSGGRPRRPGSRTVVRAGRTGTSCGPSGSTMARVQPAASRKKRKLGACEREDVSREYHHRGGRRSAEPATG